MQKKAEDTPMIRQFFEVKAQHPEAILLYRVGDFYETYADDAVTAGMLAFSSASSGIGSAIGGGNFWQGAAVGLTTAGLNHLQHKTEQFKFFRRFERQYRKGNGEDIILNKQEVDYLVKKGKLIPSSIELEEENLYKANISYYEAGTDLKYSFGTATVKFSKAAYSNYRNYLGFHDIYGFDAKTKGARSVISEIITRGYGAAVKGNSFHIYYNKRIF